MDGSSYFPSRPEMEAQPGDLRGPGRASPSATAVAGPARRGATTADGERFGVETTDGAYTCDTLVVAVGVAQPRTPPGPGMELSHHYADVRPAESYAGHRVFIAGKQNSGFELANGLLPWACQVVLASPSHAKLSVVTNSLVGVRARYVQPYEDHALGGGVSILDAAIDRVERVEGGDGVARRSICAGPTAAARSSSRSTTSSPRPGSTARSSTCRRSAWPRSGPAGCPARRPWWESSTVPGIFFAGTIGQGAKGLQRHGMPSNSGAVHGARYNARLLAGRIATTRFGHAQERPAVAPDDLVALAARELAEAPELWHQKGYLARIFSLDPEAGLVDDGVQPLAHWLDTGMDGLALTLEADGTGSIYPVAVRPPRDDAHRADARPGSAPALRHARGATGGRRPRGDGHPGDAGARLRPAPSRDSPTPRRKPLATDDEDQRSGDDESLSAGASARTGRGLEASSRRFGKARSASLSGRAPAREKNDEPGTRGDARVVDEAQGEGYVVLAVAGEVADVGHDVVRAGRVVVDAEPGRAQGRQQDGAPLAVLGQRARGSSRPGTARAVTAAAWSGAAAPTVRKSWTRRMPTDSSGEAIVQPMRQPVTEYVFDIEWMLTVRSAMPGIVASGMCSPSYTRCS